MEKIDERVRLPILISHLLWITVGVTGTTFVLNDGATVDFTDTFIMFAASIFSGIFTYGLINLIGDIRRGKNITGTIKEIKKNIKRNL